MHCATHIYWYCIVRYLYSDCYFRIKYMTVLSILVIHVALYYWHGRWLVRQGRDVVLTRLKAAALVGVVIVMSNNTAMVERGYLMIYRTTMQCLHSIWPDFVKNVFQISSGVSAFRRVVPLGTLNSSNLPVWFLNSVCSIFPKNTVKKYRYAFDAWCKWCRSFNPQSIQTLLASDYYISLYLIHLTKTFAPAAKLNKAI